jgi:hypothetical protein
MKAVEARERHRAKMARRGLRSELPPLSLRPDDQQSNDFRRWEASWMARD